MATILNETKDLPKTLILIPARFQSTRFPGKLLAPINGVPMILRVYRNMLASQMDVVVVTDHEKIESLITENKGQVVRIDDEVSSGSDRIYLAYHRYFSEQGYQLIINVQGDEPLLTGGEVSRLAQFHWKSSFDLATLVRPRQGREGYGNPNIVKVALNPTSGDCHYFSRAPIPHYREVEAESDEITWFQHIGVYSYRPLVLQQFVNHLTGYLEAKEKLEQLRALDMGFSIGALETQLNLVGVDTMADLKQVEDFFNA